MTNNKMKDAYENLVAPNGNPCMICGEPINFMLKGEEDRKDIVHVFCSIWGHSIKEHDYINNCKKANL